MNLVPYPVTALALSDAQGTGGKNIVAGAVITMTDLDLNVITMFDDAEGGAGSTSKSTGADGTKVIYVGVGTYLISVNGSTTTILISQQDIASIARSLNALDSDIIYATDTTTAIPAYIYDASQQKTYSVPTGAVGKLIASVADNQLTTSDSGIYTIISILNFDYLANKKDPEKGAALIGLNGVSLRSYLDLMSLNFKTLNDAVLCVFLRVGDTVNIAEREQGYGGGADWHVVLNSEVVVNGSDILASTGSPLLALVLLKTEYLNAKIFGAISDGVFDSAPALQAYADYCAQNDLIMHIPAGKYVVRTPINITGSPQIIGDRELTVIEFYGAYLWDVTPDAPLATFCEIKNMTLVKRGATGIAIAVGRGTVVGGFIQGLTIEAVYFQRCNYGAVVHNSRNVIITKCRAIHCDVVIALRGQNVLTRVENNDFTAGAGAKVAGIQVTADSNYTDGLPRNAENLQIFDNRIYGFNQGIRVEKCLFGSVRDNDIDAVTAIGVYLDLVTDFTVKNNWIAINAGNAASAKCIEIVGKSSYSPSNNMIYILNNRMRSYDNTCWAAIHVGGYRENIYLAGNSTISGVSYALWTELNTKKMFLTGNMFANGGVVIKSQGATLDSNLINSLNITDASGVSCKNNQGSAVTNANLVLSMPAGATSGTLTVAGLPAGASLKFFASDVGGASRGNIYLRSNGSNVITAEVDAAIGVPTSIPVYIEVFKA